MERQEKHALEITDADFGFDVGEHGVAKHLAS
jgi:hypothetical protein